LVVADCYPTSETSLFQASNSLSLMLMGRTPAHMHFSVKPDTGG
jgi:hypothetical protein